MANSLINTSNSLAFLSQDNTPLTTSKILADALNYDHYKVLQLIREHKKDLEYFGKVCFKTLENHHVSNNNNKNNVTNQHFTSELYNAENKENFVKTGRKTEIAYLNEEQATLLVAFMRNLKKVVEIKIKLVQSFCDLKRQVLELQNKLIQQKETAQKLEFNRALTEMYDLGKRHGYEERGRSVMSADEFENMCKVFQFLFDERSNSIGFMHDLTEILHKLTAIKEHLNLMGTGYIATHSQIINSLKRIREEKAKK